MAEIVKKERAPYRIWDKINNRWNELMFKTSARSVDADDGKTLENKVGAIDGITSDINGDSDNIAASIKCVNELNNSLPTFIYDDDGRIIGYIPIGGADTVIPFGGLSEKPVAIAEITNQRNESGDSKTVVLEYINQTKKDRLVLVVSGGVRGASCKTDGEIKFNDKFQIYSAVSGSAYASTSFYFITVKPEGYVKITGMSGAKIYKLNDCTLKRKIETTDKKTDSQTSRTVTEFEEIATNEN